MSPNVNLPDARLSEFVSHQAIRPEWVIDPAFLRLIDQPVAIKIAGIRMQHLADQAKLEARAANLRARMFGEIAGLLNG